ERDYARKVILKGKASKEIPVREIMSTHVLYVRPQQTVEDCMALMTDKRVRHLPVMEEERLVGVISIGDVVKAIIAEQEFMKEQPQEASTGSYSRPGWNGPRTLRHASSSRKAGRSSTTTSRRSCASSSKSISTHGRVRRPPQRRRGALRSSPECGPSR